jgi:hemerythrin
VTAAWEEPWSRLMAFRQHLPEHYEIHESLIGTYHELLAEMEQATGFPLGEFPHR